MNSFYPFLQQELLHEVKRSLPEKFFIKEKNTFAEISESHVAKNSLCLKDIIPDIRLTDMRCNVETFEKLIGKYKYLILTFSRGNWSPFSNLGFKFLQDYKKKFNKHSATLASVVPQTPDRMHDTVETSGIKFTILTDLKMELAKKFGLVYTLDPSLWSGYRKLGLDYQYCNENGNYELPIPATYIIDRDQRIVQKYVELNYVNRINPEKIIKFLTKA